MQQFKSIVILTGAGISAESGIKTFRAADGLWENHRIEEVASPEGFAANPVLVQDFYNQRRRQLLSDEVKENLAHEALARLEREFAGDVLLVTQNIDDLHERAGSKNVIHMHGELLKKRCSHSNEVTEVTGDIEVDEPCQCRGRKGTLRPHIVWFGEMPFEMERIEMTLAKCDLFVSIGTSGNVYPAAGFVASAKMAGASTRSLNLDPSNNESAFDSADYGLATKLVPDFVESLLSN